MSDDEKIHVDARQPATLNNGAGVLTDCPTLQEAVLAWHRLAPEQKKKPTSRYSADPCTMPPRSSGFNMDRNRPYNIAIRPAG